MKLFIVQALHNTDRLKSFPLIAKGEEELKKKLIDFFLTSQSQIDELLSTEHLILNDFVLSLDSTTL